MSDRRRLDLRPGVSDPVLLLISRREVEAGDLGSVLSRLTAIDIRDAAHGALDRDNIDHICIDTRLTLIESIRTFAGIDADGKRLTDHNGMVVTVQTSLVDATSRWTAASNGSVPLCDSGALTFRPGALPISAVLQRACQS